MAATRPERPRVVKKTVPIAATPIALASCCTALRTPEAEPTSRSLTAARMKSNSGEMSMPIPAPRMSWDGISWAEVVARPCARMTLPSHQVPAAMTEAATWSAPRPRRGTMTVAAAAAPTAEPAANGARVSPA
jgi:hypothetical protein